MNYDLSVSVMFTLMKSYFLMDMILSELRELVMDREAWRAAEIPPSSRDEGLRLLHGLATNLATSLQTPQEA